MLKRNKTSSHARRRPRHRRRHLLERGRICFSSPGICSPSTAISRASFASSTHRDLGRILQKRRGKTSLRHSAPENLGGRSTGPWRREGNRILCFSVRRLRFQRLRGGGDQGEQTRS